MGYNTKQREAIYNLLEKSEGKHFTAEDLMKSLFEKGDSVGKATVYRYLEKLVKRGEVIKYIIEEGKSACYQFVGEAKVFCNHYHLICSECERLIHVDCDYLDEVGEHVLKHHGFEMSNGKTILRGVCSNCRDKGKEI
ncbi:MAG TPA: transcriptional repressor [Clostridia bacterium]|nr:transcriptional repressor [Clostridia bacterium]